MMLKAIIYKADVPNVNNVIYPSEELKKAVDDFNKKKNKEVYLTKFPYDETDQYVIGSIKSLTFENSCIVSTIQVNKENQSVFDFDDLSEFKCLPSTIADIDSETKKVSNVKIVKIGICRTCCDTGDLCKITKES